MSEKKLVSESSARLVPAIASGDNDKVLKVVNGSAAWSTGGGGGTWGSITGTLSNQTDLSTALGSKVAKSGSIPSLPNDPTISEISSALASIRSICDSSTGA